MDLERETIIAENLLFFEAALPSVAARHFFLEAVRCSEPTPVLSLAGVVCLLHGIEGALGQVVYEKHKNTKASEDDPLEGKNIKLTNKLLKSASQLGFDIETLAFPDEKGKMIDVVKRNEPVGIVCFRNEFSHGKAARLAQKLGNTTYSDTLMLKRHFLALLMFLFHLQEKWRGLERLRFREIIQRIQWRFSKDRLS